MTSSISRRGALAVIAGISLASFTGCGGGGAKHSTPEAAFDAMKASLEKKDWKGFCQTLTPESRDQFATAMAIGATFMKGFIAQGGDEGKKAAEKMDAALSKHGLTDEHLKSLPEGGPESSKEAVDKFLAPVKDRDAFVADLMAAFESLPKGESPPMPVTSDAKLKDVKTEGDSATGTIEYTAKGETKTDSIKFKKIDGSWRIEIDEKMGKGPPP